MFNMHWCDDALDQVITELDTEDEPELLEATDMLLQVKEIFKAYEQRMQDTPYRSAQMLSRKTKQYMGLASKVTHTDGVDVHSGLISSLESYKFQLESAQKTYGDYLKFFKLLEKGDIPPEQAGPFSDANYAQEISDNLRTMLEHTALAYNALWQLI